jgi:hypothetical protein
MKQAILVSGMEGASRAVRGGLLDGGWGDAKSDLLRAQQRRAEDRIRSKAIPALVRVSSSNFGMLVTMSEAGIGCNTLFCFFFARFL